MKLKTKLITAYAVATAAFAVSAQAAVVAVTEAYGHNNKDNFGGNISDVFNGSGMNGYNWTSPNANNYNAAPGTWPVGEGDPATWTSGSGQYRDEWQSNFTMDNTTSIDGKLGWIILDLGAVTTTLDEMYVWNGIQIGTNAVADYRLHYSTAPIVPGTTGPTNNTAVDYDFSVAAWTQIGGTQTMTDGSGAANDVVALGGITARYIALEFTSKLSGSTTAGANQRIGFAEVAFTRVVPEPSSTALLGLGGLALILRRRR
jgi:hypothetical protein